MSTDSERTASVERLRRRALAVVWGDRTGLLIFLASLCLFGLVWRTSFVINDSYTLANGLYALERGSVDMTTAAYGPGLETPGANYYDGELFSRNYGALVAALPFVLALRAAAVVADLRIVLIAAWCLLLLATILLAGRLLDQRRYASYGGSIVVAVLFAGNVAIADPLDPPQYHLLALQIVHMLGAAFIGVFTYRLVAEVHERRRALLATALVTLGTPLAFWAAVPKRHVLTGAVALAVAFALARSRDGDRQYSTATRSLAYALVGFLAWVHAPEALVLLFALVIVDLPTAPSNDIRTLSIVGGVFLLSLIPMGVTNMAITGHPLKVPRAIGSFGSGGDISLSSGSSTGGSGAAGSDSGGSGSGGGGGNGAWRVPGFVLIGFALVQSALEPVTKLFNLFSGGVTTAVNQPEELYHAFIRSGYLKQVARQASDSPAANLSLLESAPVLAALLALVPSVWTRIRADFTLDSLVRRITPVDAFVTLLAIGYSLVYISRLPIHAQVTVRYLFPLYPLIVYGLIRLPPVGGALHDNWRTFAWTYAGAVFVGGQLLLVTLVFLAPGRGEVFQFHALLALAVACPVALWALSGRWNDQWGRFGAATMALATAAATTFVLFVSLEYYALGDSHALPMMRALAERISIL